MVTLGELNRAYGNALEVYEELKQLQRAPTCLEDITRAANRTQMALIELRTLLNAEKGPLSIVLMEQVNALSLAKDTMYQAAILSLSVHTPDKAKREKIIERAKQ